MNIPTKYAYDDMKELIKTHQWEFLTRHLMDIANDHKIASANYAAKGRTKDSERQAWLAEGIEESIGEPESIINQHESMTGKIRKFCLMCGSKISEVISRERFSGQRTEE